MNKITLFLLVLVNFALPVRSQETKAMNVYQTNDSLHATALVKIQRVTFQGKILLITTSEGIFRLPLNDIDYITFGIGDTAVENIELTKTRITLIGDQLHIESEHAINNLYLVDMTGKMLINKKLSSQCETTITLPQTGAWVIFLDTTKGYIARKIIKK